MGLSVEAIEAMGEKFGIPTLPMDHPEFMSGPQVHFLSRTSSRSKQKASDSTTLAGSMSTTPPESKDNS